MASRPVLETTVSFTLAFLDIIDRVRRIPLCEDSLFLGERQVPPALANGCQEGHGIELTELLVPSAEAAINCNSSPKT